MPSEAQGIRKKVVIERTFNARIEDVWELWTTSDGIESWWGPEGFAVKVHGLDLRPGGELTYAMTATAPEQAEFLKKAGMPLTQQARVIYTRWCARAGLLSPSWPTSSPTSSPTRWQ